MWYIWYMWSWELGWPTGNSTEPLKMVIRMPAISLVLLKSGLFFMDRFKC